MRVVTVIGVLLAGGAATLTAQHAHQLEFGGFTSWTRYDRAFGLNNTFDSWKSLGFGGRIGYFLSDYVGLEVDANVATPTYKATGDTTTAVLGSASLIINSGTGGNVLYLLGGYARLHLGPTGPMTSDLNAFQGGIGDRIFFGTHIALRLEARAGYRSGSSRPPRPRVDHREEKRAVRRVRAVVLPVGAARHDCGAQPERGTGEHLLQQRASHHGRRARVSRPAAGRAVRRWRLHDCRAPESYRGEMHGLLAVGTRSAAGRGRQRREQGVLLVDGGRRHQAGSAGAVRPLHPDVVGRELLDPGHHPHVPGRPSLQPGQRQGRGPRPAVSASVTPRVSPLSGT